MARHIACLSIAAAALTSGGGLGGGPALGAAAEPSLKRLLQDSTSSKLQQTQDAITALGDEFQGVVAILPRASLDAGGITPDVLTAGRSSLEEGTPYAAEAMFPIGSNTKMHVAISIYQLQEQGLLNVTAPVNDHLDQQDFASFGLPKITKWCPQVPGSTDCQQITFVNLMEMSSGLKEPFNCDDSGEIVYTATCFWNSTDIFNYSGHIADYLGLWIDAPLNFAPGARYHYNNGNWILLSYLIEKLSEQPLADYLHDNIYKHVTPDVDGDMLYDPYGGQLSMIPRRVSSYRFFIDSDTGARISTGSCTPYVAPGVVSGAGGAFATVAAEVDLYRQLFDSENDLGGQFLSSASLLELVKPRMQIAPGAPMYFGQGTLVTPANATAATEAAAADALPAAILYCGGIECTNTCVVRTAGGVFAAWSTVELDNVTRAEFASLADMSMNDAINGAVQGVTYPHNRASVLIQEVTDIWAPQAEARAR